MANPGGDRVVVINDLYTDLKSGARIFDAEFNDGGWHRTVETLDAISRRNREYLESIGM